jgi:hypothetical protein
VVDLEWPGWVEVQLRESHSTVVSLVDKAPVFDDAGRLTAGTTLPLDVDGRTGVMAEYEERIDTSAPRHTGRRSSGAAPLAD